MSIKEFGGIIINPGCDNYCVFCRQVPAPNQKELMDQERNVLKCLLEFRRKGIKKIEISGSDPIQYRQIIKLIKYVKKLGFPFVQLSTHGSYLMDNSFRQQLINSGISQLRIPLYGSASEIHDAVTRKKESFNKVVDGIKKIRQEEPLIRLQISTLITMQNKEDLSNMIDLMIELDIKDYYIAIPMIKFKKRKDLSWYIPLKDMRPCLLKAFQHSIDRQFSLKFMEIPYCVFGFFHEAINNQCQPPDHGTYCQPRHEVRSGAKDLPSYRTKKKPIMCKNCQYYKKCDGFVLNDWERFGTGSLKPLTQAIENKL